MSGFRHRLIAVALLTLGLAASASAKAPMHTFLDFKVKRADGHETALSAYKGKVVLVVNTASRCGFTPQYEALEALHKQYSARGFSVLGFPANDFGGQEPGTDAEIQKFCSLTDATPFPVFAKITVKGPAMHPLYTWLTQQSGFTGDIRWNFTKFLIGPDGHVLARFDSAVTPGDSTVTSAIEHALAVKAN